LHVNLSNGGRGSSPSRPEEIGLFLFRRVDGFSDDVVVDLLGLLRFRWLCRRLRRGRRCRCLRLRRCFRRRPELAGSRCRCSWRGYYGCHCGWRRDRRLCRWRHGNCGLNRRNRQRRDRRSGWLGWNWTYSDRLTANRLRFSSHPGIQDHSRDRRKAKLQNRGKQSRNVKVALAKVERGLGISAHDPSQQWQDQVVGDRGNKSPDPFRQDHGNHHAADPFTSIRSGRFWRVRSRNFIHRMCDANCDTAA